MAPVTAADLPAEHYLEERYHGPRSPSRLLSAYYTLKPAIPRSLQLALRRRYARRQVQTEFPRWPIEPILIERREAELRAELDRRSGRPLPEVGAWPDGRRFASILTHDVEGPLGVRNVPRVLDLERRHGFVSSWNFVAEWYPIPDGLFDHVRRMGGEIGLHAIKHDCKLFESRANFEADLPAIHRYLREWQAVGFRSPATHRNADWMPELGCLYDSSFPDTDPFEPQSGGCCSILPYFLDDLVELPITLVQDHTMWEILRRPGVDLWLEKAEWIRDNHGLVNLDSHPDYLIQQGRLDLYDQFLGWLTQQEGGWHALPRDVASWWKDRAKLHGDAEGASVAHAREANGRIVYDI